MNIEPTGDPLVFSDKGEATVVIAVEAMKVKVEGKFRQRERKLFVLLVHAAWNELREKTR
ncbi:MAG: hypothetical protein F6K58_30115, partial [Symploca sp. SIO2E9]|nr:hypothetical protein [Symploca sp. SIO2E9]